MGALVSWLVFQLPWQFQAVIVLAVAAGIWWCIHLVNPELARKLIVPIIGLAGVFVFWNKSKQEGYAQRVAEEKEALDKAEEVVDDKRDEIEALPDDKLDERLDRWTPR